MAWVARADIRDVESDVGEPDKCGHCFGPPEVELRWRQNGWRGMRDLYLALGDRLKAARARKVSRPSDSGPHQRKKTSRGVFPKTQL